MKKKIIIGLGVLLLGLLLIGFWMNFVPSPKVSSDNITLNNTNYELKFSNCENDSSSCLNEYYKKDEYDYKWTELLTVVYRKDIPSSKPFTFAMLQSNPISNIVYQGKDYDIIYFYIPYEYGGKQYIEQNIAKIITTKDNTGIVSIQYAIRHQYNEENKDELKKNLLKITKKYAKILKKMDTPDVHFEKIQKW